jgi:hypothetical protein
MRMRTNLAERKNMATDKKIRTDIFLTERQREVLMSLAEAQETSMGQLVREAVDSKFVSNTNTQSA